MASLVIGGLALLFIASVWWCLWRVLNGDKPIESGGSYGRQFFGRYGEPKKPDDNGQT
jgi:hypothetical protein